jgi:hypothetical protein
MSPRIAKKMIDHGICSLAPAEQAADQHPNQQCAYDALRGMCGDALLGVLEEACDLVRQLA